METTSDQIRLLLVDDELEFLDATTQALTRRGFVVGLAQDGRTALMILERQPFDVVILDVCMPRVDGWEVLRQLKRGYPQLPVILLTGHGSVEQALAASREGAFEYLTKPCAIEQMAEAALRAHGQRALRSPLAPPSPQATAEDEPVRLLFVDDEPDLLGSLSEALRRRGITVATATSGDEALRYLSAHTFDVALVDAKMPGMDGIALLQHIKQLQPLTEVLVLTGHPSMGLAVEGLKEGLCDFLMKPQNPDILADKIRAARRVRRLRSQLQQEQQTKRLLAGKPS